MKPILRELIWVIFILLITAVSALLAGNSAMDINMHDTYIQTDHGTVNASMTGVLFSRAILLALLVYLFRVVYVNFKNIVTNVILMIINGLAIFHFSTNMIIELNGYQNMGLIIGYSKSTFFIYFTIKILLILLLGLTGFMTGKNFRKPSVDKF